MVVQYNDEPFNVIYTIDSTVYVHGDKFSGGLTLTENLML